MKGFIPNTIGVSLAIPVYDRDGEKVVEIAIEPLIGWEVDTEFFPVPLTVHGEEPKEWAVVEGTGRVTDFMGATYDSPQAYLEALQKTSVVGSDERDTICPSCAEKHAHD